MTTKISPVRSHDYMIVLMGEKVSYISTNSYYGGKLEILQIHLLNPLRLR